MLISTHLPPPVMIESTDSLALVTHMLCCSWGMYFSAAPSSENDHGSMNLASKTAPVASTMPSRVAAIQRTTGCWTRRWTPVRTWPVLRSIPVAVEGFGDHPKLDDEVAREVLRLDLAALLPPQPDEGGFIIAHDDPGVRAADECPAIFGGAQRWKPIYTLRHEKLIAVFMKRITSLSIVLLDIRCKIHHNRPVVKRKRLLNTANRCDLRLKFALREHC